MLSDTFKKTVSSNPSVLIIRATLGITTPKKANLEASVRRQIIALRQSYIAY